MQLEGIVNVLKPPGMTSSDAVADIRRIFQMKRVGHTGTLDPGAAGVLPICIGRATRLFDYLVDKEKQYIAELAIGIETDTQDSYGTSISCSEKHITEKQIIDVLPRFLGEQVQIAPMYSAIKFGGKKLYQLARGGEAEVRIERNITIHALKYVRQTAPNKFLIEINCSKGTYVRTLCHDIAKALGTCGHMSFLLRTKSGDFCLEQTYSIDELKLLKEQNRLHETVVSVDNALNRLVALNLSDLSEKEEKLLYNGAEVLVKNAEVYPENVPVRVYCSNKFLGIGIMANSMLHIKTFFNEVE